MIPKKFNEANVTYGESQEQYIPLPAHKAPNGEAIFCFELTEEEKQQVAETGEIWVSLLTFNKPLQPIYITTDKNNLFEAQNDESSSIVK